MYPIFFQNDWALIPTWHVFFLLAIFSAYFYSNFLRERFYTRNFSKKKLTQLFLAVYIGGYLGARFVSLMVEEEKKLPWEVLLNLLSLGPMTFYGALLGGILFGTLSLRKKFFILIGLDIGVPSTLLGLSVGRIGCYFNGDDYGIPAHQLSSQENPWWAVTFPNHSDPIPRVPIQLIESFTSLLLTFLLFHILNRKTKPGTSGLIGILTYTWCRFLIEFFRGDSRGFIYNSSLSTSQGISLILAIATVFFLLRRKNSY